MFYLWLLLSSLMRHPVLAGIVILALWLAADRAWFRTSSPWRWIQRRNTAARLRIKLDINPHDRDARFQLAELLVERGEHDEAATLLRKNIDAGDDDVETLWLAGKAEYGSSHAEGPERGEALLAKARAKQPSFRSGAIDLELGRGRLGRQRYDASSEALRDAILARPGSVEAHVLLARACAGAGKVEAANDARREAWRLYRESPRFKRRQDRGWAWKARPVAAVQYYGIIGGVVGVVVVGLAGLPGLVPREELDVTDQMNEGPEEGWNVDTANAPSASRFVVEEVSRVETSEGGSVLRFDLNGNGEVDLRRKLFAGDLWCRLLAQYPALADARPSGSFLVEDTASGITFVVSTATLQYQFSAGDTTRAREAVLAFEAVLESGSPQDCVAEVEEDGVTEIFGVRDGAPFERVVW